MKGEQLDLPFSNQESANDAETQKQAKIAELRTGVASSVRQVLNVKNSGETEDLRPEMDFVIHEVEKSNLLPKRNGETKALAGLDEKKFFWDLVGDALKESSFKFIGGDIMPLIEKADYSAAENVINEKIRETVKKLSSSLYKDADQLQVALSAIRQKFYETFPEIKALIYGVGELKKQRMRTPSGKWPQKIKEKKPTGEKGERPMPDQPAQKKTDHEPKAGATETRSNPRYISERTWKVPILGELQPGLIIIVKSELTGSEETVRLLSKPALFEGELIVDTETLTEKGPVNQRKRFLSSMGLQPNKQGNWDSWYKPVSWHRENDIHEEYNYE